MAKCRGWNVVVTGASSGIGRAAAVAFGHQGATLWLGARDVHELETTAKFAMAEGGTARVHALDVTRSASVRAFAEWVDKEAGCLDVIVNNAGVGAWGTIDDLTEETWRRAIDTNLTGPFLVTKALLPLLRRREGRRHILNIVSVAGRQGFPGNGAYAASKFGLRGWTEALALELAPEGIRVTNVSPGYVATHLTARAGDAEKMIQPDDLARLLVDLTLAPDSLFQDEVVVWPWRQYTE